MNLKINRLENLVAAALPCCQLLPQIISRRLRGEKEGSGGEDQEGVGGACCLGLSVQVPVPRKATRVRRGFCKVWVLPICQELEWLKAELPVEDPFPVFQGRLLCPPPG